MTKPTYYLWKSDFETENAFLYTKEQYTNLGFRVVTYQDGQNTSSIHDGLKALIKNHFIDD